MRIYIAGLPEEGDEYVEAKAVLERKGYQVVCNPTRRDDEGLRIALSELALCDAICLLESWWADLQATQLASVAAWLYLPVLDAKGEKVPTGSLRNLR